jgi:hypothetical protein
VVGRGSLIIGERGDLLSGLEVEIGGECGIKMDGKIDFVTGWDFVSFTVLKGSDCVAFVRVVVFLGFAPVNFPIRSSLSLSLLWESIDWVLWDVLSEDIDIA